MFRPEWTLGFTETMFFWTHQGLSEPFSRQGRFWEINNKTKPFLSQQTYYLYIAENSQGRFRPRASFSLMMAYPVKLPALLQPTASHQRPAHQAIVMSPWPGQVGTGGPAVWRLLHGVRQASKGLSEVQNTTPQAQNLTQNTTWQDTMNVSRDCNDHWITVSVLHYGSKWLTT